MKVKTANRKSIEIHIAMLAVVFQSVEKKIFTLILSMTRTVMRCLAYFRFRVKRMTNPEKEAKTLKIYYTLVILLQGVISELFYN